MSAVSHLEAVEFADNPEPRCPCVLLMDTSGSMQGARIEALNAGLAAFKDNMMRDPLASRRVEIAIVTFSSRVDVLQSFVTIDKLQTPHLAASGETHMGRGIHCALDLTDDRKKTYRALGVPHYRPWIFLITDGMPEGETEEIVQEAARRVRETESRKGVAFFAVGVEDADMAQLAQMAPPDRPPLKLQGLKFSEMFLWLSASMQTVSRSDTAGVMVSLPPVGWGHVSQ